MKRIRIIALPAALLLAVALSGCAQTGLRLSGTVECTQYDVQAQAAGTLVAVDVGEGDQVRKGDVLARVDDAAQQAAVAQAQAAVDARQARLDGLKAGSRAEQIDTAEAAERAAAARYEDIKNGPTDEQVNQARAASRAAASARDTAKKSWQHAKSKADKAQKAYDDGALTKDLLDDANWVAATAYGIYKTASEQANQASAAYAAARKGPTAETVAAAQAAWDQTRAQLEMARNGAAETDIRAAQADLDGANAALAAAKVALSRCQVIAPADGIVTLWNPKAGALVNAGGFVATLRDVGDLWMHLYVPQSQLKLISLGQTLELVTPAYPGETFRGIVQTIAAEAEFTPRNTQTEQGVENTVFKVKVRIEDGEHKLRSGMTMQVTLDLGQVQ